MDTHHASLHSHHGNRCGTNQKQKVCFITIGPNGARLTFLTNDGQLLAVQLAQLELQHAVTCTYACILHLPHPLCMLRTKPGSSLTIGLTFC